MRPAGLVDRIDKGCQAPASAEASDLFNRKLKRLRCRKQRSKSSHRNATDSSAATDESLEQPQTATGKRPRDEVSGDEEQRGSEGL